MSNIQAAFAAHLSHQLSRARVIREVTWHDSWHVPSEQDETGSVGLRLLQGGGGEWWLIAFSDAAGLTSYANSTRLVPPDKFVVVKGSSLFRNMPGGVAAVAFDVHSPQTVSFQAAEVPLLRQYGMAFEVEAALARTSKREDPLSFVRDYDGYRLLRHRQSGQFAYGVDNTGRRGIAVFTTEDALEAFLAQSNVGNDPGTERLVLGGAELFGRLGQAESGLLVNCSGPQPFALDGPFAQAVLASSGATAPIAAAPGGAAGSPTAGDQASRPTPGVARPAAPNESAWAGTGGAPAAMPGLFGRRQPLVADPALPPLADARRQPMAFGREVLPALVASDGRGLVTRLRGPDSSGVLAELWQQAAGGAPASPPTGLAVVGVEEQNGTTLLVIQFPQARAMLEGHAAAISVGPAGNRYFLFERSTDDEEGALVERTGGDRTNMGFVPVELGAFVAAVCSKIGLTPAAAPAATAQPEPPAATAAQPPASAGPGPNLSDRTGGLAAQPGLVGDRVTFDPSHVAPSQLDAVQQHVDSGQQMAKQLNNFGLFVGAARLYTNTHAAVDPTARTVEKGLALIALGVCVTYQAGNAAESSMWLDGYHAAMITGDREKMAELAAIPEAAIRAGEPDVPEFVMRYIRAHSQRFAEDERFKETLVAALEEQPRVLAAGEPDDRSHVALLSALFAAAAVGDEESFNAEMETYLRFHHAYYAMKPPDRRLGGSMAIGAVALAGVAHKRGIKLRGGSDYVPAWLVR